MKIYTIDNKRFLQYGRQIENPYYEIFKERAKEIAVPETGSVYRASEPMFEIEQTMSYYTQVFGGMDIQIGYCYGFNDRLNALEWHKNSEMCVALSDMVLLLGDVREMRNGKYDSKKLKAFLLKAGESVELYATTLHFCPIHLKNESFKNVVILPRGTNTPLKEMPMDKRLISKNKWLIIHPEFTKQVELGREIGIVGKNIIIK